MRMAVMQIMFLTPVALILAPVGIYILSLFDKAKKISGSLYIALGVIAEIVIIICAIAGFNYCIKAELEYQRNQVKQDLTLETARVYDADYFINDENIHDIKVAGIEYANGVGEYSISPDGETFVLYGNGDVSITFEGPFYDVYTRTGEYTAR